MSKEKPDNITGLKRELELLHALNTTAAALQQVASSEGKIFSVFGNQLKPLNLHGSLHLLNEAGDRLTIQAATPSNRMLGHLESLTGIKVVGYQIELAQAHIYREILAAGAARFVADNTEILRQLVPQTLNPFLKHVLKTFGGMPGVFAPFRIGAEIGGLVSIVGEAITAADVPAVTAFANHLGVALQNARLFAALQKEIATRKQAEQTLAQSESHYQLLYENVPQGYQSLDADGRILDANDIWFGMLGYSREEVLGRWFGDFLASEKDVARFRKRFAGFKTTGKVTRTELNLRRKDGTRVVVSVNGRVSYKAQRKLQQIHCTLDDITHRRQAEQRLQDSEAKYRTLFEALTDAIFLVSPEGLIIDCNTAAGKMHGYACKNEVIGLSVTDLVADDNAADLPHMALSRSKLALRVTARRKDGSLFPTETSVATVSVGSRQLLLVYAKDITAREQAEADIRHRNRKLALLNQIIAASAMDMPAPELLETVCRELATALTLPRAYATLMQADSQSYLVAAEYYEPPRSSLLGQVLTPDNNSAFAYMAANQAPLVLDIPDEESPSNDLYRMAQAHRIVSIIILPLFVDNTMAGCIHLAAEYRRSFSDEEIDLAWSVADQTANALSRTWSNEKRRQLITAVEQLAESIVIIDAQGFITYTNPAFERNTGYSQTEALGRHIHFLAAETDAAPEFQFAALSAEASWRGRLTICRKDGAERIIEAAVSPVLTVYGQLINYVLIYRDITDDLAKEEQYYRAQRMEAVGQLAAGIAHDFNNLLTTINGFAELVHDQLEQTAPQRSSLQHIIRSGQRAAKLVHQLLAFSRKQMISPRKLDLNQTIRQAMPTIRQSTGDYVTVETHLADDLWSLKMDPGQIEQILVHLSLNARDAMPDGGQLTIETGNITLDESYAKVHSGSRAGQYVQLTVTDTGYGISEAVQKRIFEPFFTTKEVGQGTGLGLSSVYGSVKQNRGNIWVYSETGKGTTFKIYLPRMEIIQPDDTPPIPSTEMPTGTETIILAEDDDYVRSLVVWVLEGQGYTVLPTANGEAALQTAGEHQGPIDLLVSDVVMDGLDGFQLKTELQKTRPELKVLFMSGYSEAALVPHGMSVSRQAFLSKPFSPVALAQKVRIILDS